MLKAFTGVLQADKSDSKGATALHEDSHGMVCDIWTPFGVLGSTAYILDTKEDTPWYLKKQI